MAAVTPVAGPAVAFAGGGATVVGGTPVDPGMLSPPAGLLALRGRASVAQLVITPSLHQDRRDLTGRPVMLMVGSCTVETVAAVVPVPAGLHPSWEVRVVDTMPNPVLDRHGNPVGWVPTITDHQEVGRLRVVIGGKDVTFFRGVPTDIPRWDQAKPMGPRSASVRFPQISAHERLGRPGTDTAWFRKGAKVSIDLVDHAGRVTRTEWEGKVLSVQTDATSTSQSRTALCAGDGLLGRTQRRQPKWWHPAVDVGYAIADEMNAVIGRAYGKVARVRTGILTARRGGGESRTDYVTALTATALTDDGRDQWTVKWRPGRRFVVELQSAHRSTWTWSVGGRGVQWSSEDDAEAATTAVYGTYTSSDGCVRSNAQHPGLHADTAPDFPFTDPDAVIVPGTRDSDTVGGRGVSLLQGLLQRGGYRVRVTGVWSSSDAREVRKAQRAAGIDDDGVPGGQTWTELWRVGSNQGSTDSSYYAPWAVLPAVEPYRYNAVGARIGKNPAYDPLAVRVETWEMFGEGMTEAEVRRSAHAEIARDAAGVLRGTLTTSVSPLEGWIGDPRPGDLVRLLHADGGTLTLTITSIEFTRPVGAATTMTAELSEQGLDSMTLAAIKQRNRDNADPNRSKPAGRSRATTMQDRPVASCEGGLGVIPRSAVHGGFWNRYVIPMGTDRGTIVRLDMRTEDDAVPFVAAFFGSTRPTANDLKRYVGDATADRTDGYGPFDKNADELDALGFIEAIGGPGQLAGYWPGRQTGDDGQPTHHPVTGRQVDGAQISFELEKPPWMVVFVYSAVSTFFSAEFKLGPDGSS